MLYRGMICSWLFLAILAPSLSLAQSAEIKEYKVMGGDTLWGISGRELNDEFLWPKVWKENPQVSNPDRIYPGQTIRIPLYLLQKEGQEEPAAAAQPEAAAQTAGPVEEKPAAAAQPSEPERIPLTPLIDKSILMASGYIADSVGGVGRIAGSPSERHLFGVNDTVYVSANSGVRVGDRFYIIRPGVRVIHPVTGKALGYVVEIRGVAEITKFSYGETMARIVQMFDDIEINDILDTYYEIEPPLTSGEFRKPDVRGTVVASQSLKAINGIFDIVYIDRGYRDGLEAGDLLQTLVIGRHTIPNSLIQVISCRETTSTAVIRSFSEPVSAGNEFVKAE